MIRIPLPTPLLAALVAAFSFLLAGLIEQRHYLYALLAIVGITCCLGELVKRLVEHYRAKRGRTP